MTTTTNEPILVVGAGPTGLTLAGDLLRRGVPCRVIDKAQGPAQHSRAVAVHARSLEVLDSLGIADELIARGVRVHGGSVYAGGRRIASMSFDELDGPFPFLLDVPQTDTEELLRAHLERHGGRIEWTTSLTQLEDMGDRVRYEIQRADGTSERGLAPWVVGCDGAHSTVRKALGLPFDGAPYPETILLADVKLESSLPRDEAHTFVSEDGLILFAPLPNGRARVIATVPPSTTPLAADAPPPELSEIQALVNKHVPDAPHLTDCVWTSRFHVHHRLVPEYRKGRAFVAGDAAHIHSPAGGQGMNTGIQDAWNLGWKLALVAQGHGRPELLDSYSPERRAVAQTVVAGTDVTMKAMTLRHPVARGLRDRVLSYLSTFEVVQERLAKTASGLGLGYRKSPIVAEHRATVLDATVSRSPSSERPTWADLRDFGAAPGPGSRALDERVLLDGATSEERLFRLLGSTAHSLLLFDGRAATAEGYRNLDSIAAAVAERYRGLVNPYVIVPYSTRPPELEWGGPVILDAYAHLHHRYGAGSECLYLVRPDGYIGFRTQPARLDALLKFLDRIFVGTA